MKKAITIIKQIHELSDELHMNYSYEEIMKAIEDYEEKNGIIHDYVIDTIYENATNESGYYMK